jgi:phenylacetate-CoA ligase
VGIRNWLTRHVILPGSDKLLGQRISACLTLLEQSQWWSRGEIDNYQNERLRRLVRHAFDNVPYYHDLFASLRLRPEDIRTKEDLPKLPLLTKEIVRASFPLRLVAASVPSCDRISISSSGSTGEPLLYYLTRDSYSFNTACALRAWSWMGYRLGDPYVKLSMNARGSLVKKIQDWTVNCRYLHSRQLVEESFNRIAAGIALFRPKFLRCYPDPLTFLSQYLEKSGRLVDFLTAINTTGSTLHDRKRKVIEDNFHCPVYDSYSCEGGANVAQCETRENYHAAEEYAISEFIADDYTPSSPFRSRRLITTDLQNFAVPFIRYDTQDYLAVGPDSCACGRNLLAVTRIEGRDSDILVTPGGKFLIVENFVAYFEWLDSVNQIQVVQPRRDAITIKMIVNDRFTAGTERTIREYWQGYIGPDVRLETQVVDHIALTPSGKRRTLIRSQDIPLAGQ